VFLLVEIGATAASAKRQLDIQQQSAAFMQNLSAVKGASKSPPDQPTGVRRTAANRNKSESPARASE
jgi:hypothetical protein